MYNFNARLFFSLLLFAPVVPSASGAEYSLMPSPQTVHVGHFSAALKPVLTVNSGDIVTIERQRILIPPKSISRGWFRPAPCQTTSAQSTAKLRIAVPPCTFLPVLSS
jgi:hypothetical protein